VISFFTSVTSQTPLKDIQLTEFLDDIRRGRWKAAVEEVQAAVALHGRKDKRVAELKKKLLPAVTVSGSFLARNADGLDAHSGLVVVDFDDEVPAEGTRAAVEADAHVVAVFVGPSGIGLKVIVKAEGSQDHGAAWAAAADYLLRAHKLKADVSGKDVARLCFASYDPLAKGPREGATPIPLSGVAPAPKPASRKRKDEAYTDLEADIVLCQQALAALPPAIEGDNGDHHTFRAACLGRDFSLSRGIFLPLLLEWNDRCSPPWDVEDLKEKVRRAYRYAKNEAPGAKSAIEFDKEPAAVVEGAGVVDGEDLVESNWISEVPYRVNKDGEKVYIATLGTVAAIVRLHPQLKGCLRYNEFADAIAVSAALPWEKTFTGERALNDTDITALRQWIERGEIGVAASKDNAYDAVDLQAKRFRFHPVRDYLQSLKWDGVPRIEGWLTKYAGVAESPYVRQVGAKTLIACVARIQVPGCKVDTMLILEGQQGAKKGTAIRVLAKGWGSDMDADPGSKDFTLSTRGAWLVELPELHSFSRAEANQFKSIMSRGVDRVRDPYGRLPKDVPRQFVFFGTTNDESYLKDETGHRRFWPVKCEGKIDIEGLEPVVDQLWAEAKHRYDSGEQWWLDDETEDLQRAEASKREMSDEWDEHIKNWIAGNPDEQLTVTAIWIGALGGDVRGCSRGEQMRIGSCLTRLGYRKKAKRAGEATRKVWSK
jgi:predicted P-loop ATPase